VPAFHQDPCKNLVKAADKKQHFGGLLDDAKDSEISGDQDTEFVYNFVNLIKKKHASY